MLTVDKNGKDATQAGVRPREHRPVGLRAAARRPAGHGRLLRAPARSPAADGKTAQIPEAWAAGWKFWYDGDVDGPLLMTGPVFESDDINPEDYPFFTGKVSMSENFLWSTYGVDGAGDDWDMAAVPSYGGKPTAAFNADTFRILKDTKHPDEAFEVLTYLLGDGVHATCSRRTAACPPGRPNQAAFFEDLQAATNDEGKPRFPNPMTGRSRWTASSTPTTRTSRRSCPPTTRPSASSARAASTRPSGRPTQGLDMDAGVRGAQRRDPGDLGQAGLRLRPTRLTLPRAAAWRPPPPRAGATRRADHARSDARVTIARRGPMTSLSLPRTRRAASGTPPRRWPRSRAARPAGATCSSRPGSSASSCSRSRR